MMRTRPQPTPMSWGNAMFEPCPDGSLRVRNSTALGPYPRCGAVSRQRDPALRSQDREIRVLPATGSLRRRAAARGPQGRGLGCCIRRRQALCAESRVEDGALGLGSASRGGSTLFTGLLGSS